MHINDTDAPRRKPYAELRGLMAKYDYTQAELAKKIGCSRTYLGEAINGSTEWKLDVCYQILDLFRIPHSKLNTVFPRGGKAA